MPEAARLTQRPHSRPQAPNDLIAIVIHHLDAADRALSHSREEARAQIVKASRLLRSEYARPDGKAAQDSLDRGVLAPWQLKRALELVDAGLQAPIAISDLAGAVRLSKGYFCQAFRRSVGQSPYAYILRRRVERAQEMMLATDRPLAEIALDCGLADQSHLTKVFHRVTGLTPAAWRRLQRTG